MAGNGHDYIRPISHNLNIQNIQPVIQTDETEDASSDVFLIAEIEKFPVIYNEKFKSSDCYKEEAWQNVSETTGKSCKILLLLFLLSLYTIILYYFSKGMPNKIY